MKKELFQSILFDKEWLQKIANKIDIDKKKFPRVIGKFGQQLYASFHLAQRDIDSPYFIVNHLDESNNKVETKIHLRPRYPFPAIFLDKFPRYNAQPIYENKKEEEKIIVMEGPSNEEAAEKMLIDMCENNVEVIFVFGEPDVYGCSHFGYYRAEKPFKGIRLTIAAEELKDQKTENIRTYLLSITDTISQKKFSILIKQFSTEDGAVIFLSSDEFKAIYNLAKNKNVASHCSAGRGRSSIIPASLRMGRIISLTEIESPDIEKYLQLYAESFLAACKRRPGLCQNWEQFNQIITFSLLFTALENNWDLNDFPELFELKHAPSVKKPSPSLTM